MYDSIIKYEEARLLTIASLHLMNEDQQVAILTGQVFLQFEDIPYLQEWRAMNFTSWTFCTDLIIKQNPKAKDARLVYFGRTVNI